MKYVQFTDDTEVSIQSEFGVSQDKDLCKYQREVEDDDPRYITFVNSMILSSSGLIKAERDSLLQIAAIRITPLARRN